MPFQRYSKRKGEVDGLTEFDPLRRFPLGSTLPATENTTIGYTLFKFPEILRGGLTQRDKHKVPQGILPNICQGRCILPEAVFPAPWLTCAKVGRS